MAINEIDERRLVEEHKAGDSDAFARIVREHHRALMAHAVRRLGDQRAAEDAVQETLLRAYRALPRFNGDYHLSAWLHRILQNVCVDEGNRRTRETKLVEKVSSLPVIDTTDAALPAIVLGPDPEFDHAFSGLPSSYREALYLRYVEGLSYREVGMKAGVSEANARARVHRGRTALRRLLTGASAAVAWFVGVPRRSNWAYADVTTVTSATTTAASVSTSAATSVPAVHGVVAQVAPVANQLVVSLAPVGVEKVPVVTKVAASVAALALPLGAGAAAAPPAPTTPTTAGGEVAAPPAPAAGTVPKTLTTTVRSTSPTTVQPSPAAAPTTLPQRQTGGSIGSSSAGPVLAAPTTAAPNTAPPTTVPPTGTSVPVAPMAAAAPVPAAAPAPSFPPVADAAPGLGGSTEPTAAPSEAMDGPTEAAQVPEPPPTDAPAISTLPPPTPAEESEPLDSPATGEGLATTPEDGPADPEPAVDPAPAPEPVAADPGVPDPGVPDPGVPDPGVPDPGVPDPGTPDPGAIDPEAQESEKPGSPAGAEQPMVAVPEGAGAVEVPPQAAGGAPAPAPFAVPVDPVDTGDPAEWMVAASGDRLAASASTGREELWGSTRLEWDGASADGLLGVVITPGQVPADASMVANLVVESAGTTSTVDLTGTISPAPEPADVPTGGRQFAGSFQFRSGAVGGLDETGEFLATVVLDEAGSTAAVTVRLQRRPVPPAAPDEPVPSSPAEAPAPAPAPVPTPAPAPPLTTQASDPSDTAKAPTSIVPGTGSGGMGLQGRRAGELTPQVRSAVASARTEPEVRPTP